MSTPGRHDDTRMWEALQGSALGRLAAAVSAPWFAAAMSSRTMAACLRLREQWGRLPMPARMQTVGVMMIVAALVHIALAATRQPVGYWWLIVPGTALMFGLTSAMLSMLGRSSQ